jgi:hypothetical protein
MSTTIETIRPNDDRETLQHRLEVIDRDPAKLQAFIEELYLNHPDNPHILYAAAIHLVSLTYLDHRDRLTSDETEALVLPTPEEATQAFFAYARLLAMLRQESNSPLYKGTPIAKRLLGMREELAFHATLAYARLQEADIVALPSPATLDYSGLYYATDIQLFIPPDDGPSVEIQIKMDTKEDREDQAAHAGLSYHPRIVVMSLIDALGDLPRVIQLQGLLKSIGNRDPESTDILRLPSEEHAILLNAAERILYRVHDHMIRYDDAQSDATSAVA